jgi:hypothetical protein
VSVNPAASSAATSVRTTLRRDVHVHSRTIVLGVVVGMLSVGVLGRLAMFALAKTNPTAAGLKTDDGFTIDQFTVSGSLNLVLVGAVLGALSGVFYAVLAPLAIGPVWFRRLSLSVGAGVVAATQVVHSDGLDFVALDRPRMLAVAMFVLIPVLHVLALDLLASYVHDNDGLRSRFWTLVGVLCAVPFAAVVLPLLVARWLWLAIPSDSGIGTFARGRAWPWALRGVLAALFALAVASIGADVAALS